MIKTKSFLVFSKVLFFLNINTRKRLYKFLNSLTKITIWYKGFKKYDLIIFDNIFPTNDSPWRTYEFINYCNTFEKVKIVSNNSSKSFLNGKKFKERLLDFSDKYPDFKNIVKQESVFINVNTKLIYFLFYENLTFYIEKIERKKIPFVFTLYPGGRWELFDSEKDENIKRVINLELCRGVIVNQYVTYNYLINQLNVSPDKVKLLPGVPLPIKKNTLEFKSFPKNSEIRICFVAHRYHKSGCDKGLLEFLCFIKKLEVTSLLSFNAFVIGDFINEDFEKDLIGDRITFLGKMSEDKLNRFLSTTDFVISPNQPFKLSKGAYDGFPLSTVIAAAMNGNLILCTDFFDEGEKIGFLDQVHFIKVKPDSHDIFEKFIQVYNNPRKIIEMNKNSRLFIFEFYSFDKQIIPRINMLTEFLK